MKTKVLLVSLYIFNVFATDFLNILKKYNLNTDQVGIALYDINTKKYSNSLNLDKGFIPASTFKIISAYYLLKNNDPKKVFSTKLYSSGEIKDGVLLGNIYIVSEANPYFLTTNLYNLLFSLKEKGINEIKGRIILEGGISEIEKIGDVGLDDESYNQSFSAFNINFNRFRLFNSGKSYYTLPKIDALEISSSDKSIGPGEVVSHNNKNGIESWSYFKTSGNRHEIPVRNSKIFYSSYVEKVLENLKITVQSKEIISTDKILLANDDSVNFERLIELALEYSNNLFMEVLLLETTKEKNLKAAALKMKKILGDDFKDANIENASGLSADLFLTPKLFTNFIAKSFNEKIGDKYFFTYLSLAGSSGFIANRFLSEDLNELFFAKTGSLDYVNNICGISFKDGQKAFCIFINDFDKRKTLQGLNSQKLEDLRIKAKNWKNQTDKALDELVSEIL